eukprot:COSAG01_NODE_54746_length_330_cov_0.593074_1_plen_38_part_01
MVLASGKVAVLHTSAAEHARPARTLRLPLRLRLRLRLR